MNATKEENFYNSESEGKEYKDFDEKYDAYIQATCEETYRKEYDEDFWQEYHNNTKEKKNNSQS